MRFFSTTHKYSLENNTYLWVCFSDLNGSEERFIWEEKNFIYYGLAKDLMLIHNQTASLDGTFDDVNALKVKKKKVWSQLYIITKLNKNDKGDRTFAEPIAFCLMKKRRIEDYLELFQPFRHTIPPQCHSCGVLVFVGSFSCDGKRMDALCGAISSGEKCFGTFGRTQRSRSWNWILRLVWMVWWLIGQDIHCFPGACFRNWNLYLKSLCRNSQRNRTINRN